MPLHTTDRDRATGIIVDIPHMFPPGITPTADEILAAFIALCDSHREVETRNR